MRTLLAAVCLLGHPVLAAAALIGWTAGAPPVWTARLLLAALACLWVLIALSADDLHARQRAGRSPHV